MAKAQHKKDTPPRRSAATDGLGREGQQSAGRFDVTRINFDPQSETLDDDYAAFHKCKKALLEAERDAVEAQFQAAFAKQRDEDRRWVNNVFQFWIVCSYKACARASSCMKDPHACFARWWPVTPERHKVRYRAYVAARAEDRSHQDAQQHADAEVKRLADHIARVDAERLARLDALEAAQHARRGDPAPVAIEAAPPASPAAEAIDAQPLPRERQRGPRISAL